MGITTRDSKDKRRNLLVVVIGALMIIVGLVIETRTDSPISMIFYFVGGLSIGVGGVRAFGIGKKTISS